MDENDIRLNFRYTVDAPGATKTELFTVTAKKQNKLGEWEFTTKSEKTGKTRTFLARHFNEMDKKMAKTIVSESIELLGTINGFEMWAERIDYWPAQQRRGRKRTVK